MGQFLIINGDDFGLTDGVCNAITVGLEEGWLSSTSVMVCAAGAKERILSANRAVKDVAGVHLQLTGGFPVIEQNTNTRLGLAGGCFPDRLDVATLNPLEVEAEWEAQIARAREWGLKPTHLDSHHGVHLLPPFIDVYLRIAQRHNLPVRADRGPIESRMIEFNIRGPTRVVRDWTGNGGNVEELVKKLNIEVESAKSGDIIEVISHPAFVDDELWQVSSLNDARAGDVVGLRQFKATHEAERLGLELVSYLDAFR